MQKKRKKIMFEYNLQFTGGTEYMALNFHERVAFNVPKLQDHVCIIIPGKVLSWDKDFYLDKKIIIWAHNAMYTTSIKKWALETFNSPEISKNIVRIIGISEFHKKTLMQDFNKVPEDRFVVIPNAFDPIAFNPQKFVDVQKVKIVHASHSSRGMGLLLKSLKYVDEDFELNIFNDYYPEDLEHMFDDYPDDPRVTFWGKTPRKTVHKIMSESHIHAYPSTVEEAFCLVQVEAMSAGLLSVYSGYGALSEVSLGYGVEVPYNVLSATSYAKALTEAILTIKNGQHSFGDQSTTVNEKYSWDVFVENWKDLEKNL